MCDLGGRRFWLFGRFGKKGSDTAASGYRLRIQVGNRSARFRRPIKGHKALGEALRRAKGNRVWIKHTDEAGRKSEGWATMTKGGDVTISTGSTSETVSS